MTDIDLLRGDCSRCFGLCCVALSFERGPLFAFDKPAGEPCPNLTQQGRCAVHERLAAAGMTGCARYDCLGAGQLATEMFAAVDRTLPRNARVIGLAFARLIQIQTMRLLIRRTRPAGATELAMRLEAATRDYKALALLDLAAARRDLAAAVREGERPGIVPGLEADQDLEAIAP